MSVKDWYIIMGVLFREKTSGLVTEFYGDEIAKKTNDEKWERVSVCIDTRIAKLREWQKINIENPPLPKKRAKRNEQ